MKPPICTACGLRMGRWGWYEGLIYWYCYKCDIIKTEGEMTKPFHESDHIEVILHVGTEEFYTREYLTDQHVSEMKSGSIPLIFYDVCSRAVSLLRDCLPIQQSTEESS